MLEIRKGDIFQSGCDAVLNAVNCVGIMGAGLAAVFRTKYPQMFIEYRDVCHAGELRPGTMHVWQNPAGPLVINFPTKDEVYADSKYEYIEKGLVGLDAVIRQCGLKSVAIPALGCGLGGLKWDRVKEMIESFHASHWEDVKVVLYEPL